MNYPATALGGPRQLFGSYQNEGAALPPNALGPGMCTDDMAGYGLEDGNEHGDPKRRRIARVCFDYGCRLADVDALTLA
jgi:hypothetical protein